MSKRKTRWAALGAALLAFSLSGIPANAQQAELKADSPDRYTVQKGDTLWSIASRFLENPWHWPEIWQQNQEIDNPHLIYPGDVLVLTGTTGGDPAVRVLRERKLSKMQPEVRVVDRDDAITTIPPDAIQPFLTNPLVLEEDGLDHAGYVAAGQEGAIVLGKYNVFFAKGVNGGSSEFYNIFRPGKPLIHPVTEEFLGLQAIHLGDARVLAAGETTKMEVTSSTQEIALGDRMVPTEEDIALPYYHPHAPEREVHGYVIDIAGAVAEGGPFQTIVLSLGTREEMEPGHVVRIQRKEPDQTDVVTGGTVEIPLQDSGLAMVFRVFEKVSYALILEADRAVHLNDHVVNP